MGPLDEPLQLYMRTLAVEISLEGFYMFKIRSFMYGVFFVFFPICDGDVISFSFFEDMGLNMFLIVCCTMFEENRMSRDSVHSVFLLYLTLNFCLDT